MSNDSSGGAGEVADVYISADGANFVLLGMAFQDNGRTGFDLAIIGFTEPVVAVKIVGRDNKGGSPGFDVYSVEILPSSVGLPPIEIRLDLPPSYGSCRPHHRSRSNLTNSPSRSRSNVYHHPQESVANYTDLYPEYNRSERVNSKYGYLCERSGWPNSQYSLASCGPYWHGAEHALV